MSDAVKLIIEISEHQYEICKQALKDFGDRPITECEFAIAVGTPLDGITNGEVIQTLFPNAVIRNDDSMLIKEVLFTNEMWNNPYQKGGEEV